MNTLTKTIMLVSLILFACVCYFIGTIKGAIAFIVLGVLLEICFWVGIFKTTKKAAS
ncbi:MAG: Uncharacterised protein [Glaciecola sp. HTCC2999]|mgnify:CR=1 FL=1|nr:MAG: Uncharacterised protein [Glaciecola sp. HTCC2999]